MAIAIKYCGLTSEDTVQAACALGAAWVGCVFFPPSPRHVTPQHAAQITRAVPATVRKVAVTVDADDVQLAEIMAVYRPEVVQCHGQEMPARVRAIRDRWGVGVIKAVRVGYPDDVVRATAFAGLVEYVLYDTLPLPGDALPGGNGRSFPWGWLGETHWPTPWLLAGGLTPENVAEAVAASGAKAVDVSSGVESRPGVKDVAKMAAFRAALAAVP